MATANIRMAARVGLFLCSSSLSSVCFAQAQVPSGPPPVRSPVDENGVDLVTGSYSVPLPALSTGDGTMSFTSSIGGGFRHNFQMYLTQDATGVSVSIAGRSVHFKSGAGGTYTNDQGGGATLTQSGTFYTFTDLDGTIVTFFTMIVAPTNYDPSNNRITQNATSSTIPVYPNIVYNGGAFAVADTVTQPDGQTLTLNYSVEGLFYSGQQLYYAIYHLTSVASSKGYQVRVTYPFSESSGNGAPDYPGGMYYNFAQADGFIRDAVNYSIPSKITLMNNAVDPCATWLDQCGTTTTSWPSISIGMSQDPNVGLAISSATDATGRVWQYGYSTNSTDNNISSVQSPASTSPNVSLVYDSTHRVTSLTKAGQTWTYGRSTSGSVMTTTVTDPQAHVRVVTADTTLLRILTDTDELGRTTTYKYDTNGRLTYIIPPEGTISSGVPTAGYTKLSYDTRGNVIEVRKVGKLGSGLADIVTSASYSATCANAKTCNKPIWTKDANLNETDYTYDPTHGGILTVTGPAAPNGVHPQSRYAYTAAQPYWWDGSGQISPSGPPTYLLAATSSCQTSASCTGTADETRTTVSYSPASGTATNLRPYSVTAADGTGALSAKSAMAYDGIGNVVLRTDPLGQSTLYAYDANHELTEAVRPDSDGTGALKGQAGRFTYNGDGQVTLAETGTANSDGSGFASAQQVATAYDSAGRKTKDSIQAGGATYSTVQYSYDTLGRPDCTAVRMDPAQWASQSNVCTPQTTGPNGPDRVTRTSYDAAGQVTKVTSAYGTADASDDATATYTANGKVATATDANGSKTSYTYDGFDRLIQQNYPDKVTAGVSSGTDYETFSYDPNGNALTLRKRDGRGIAFAYDALGRLTSKTYPNGGARPVYYSYDLRGLPTAARFDSVAGTDAVTGSWDALGRQTSSTTAMSGVSRTLSYQYDVVGNRTRITHPDGAYLQYGRDVLGRLTSIAYNGGTSAFQFQYDDLGRRQSIQRGLTGGTTGAATNYTYDNVGRLAGLANATTTNPVTFGLNYNPASQIAGQTRDNDTYAWTGSVNVNRNYARNGLNQYTSAGPASFTFDANGNLTSDGTTTFGYDIENRLITTSTGWALTYDPLGRLWQNLQNGSGTQMLFDGNDLVAEYDPSGLQYSRFVHGDGQDEPLGVYTGSGLTNLTFYYHDMRGSIIGSGPATGAVSSINRYDEFGVQTGAQGRFQYTGQIWLALGLNYYKARMYSPTLGRFMQTDPIGYGDGMNWYNYVGSDPVNGHDPSGTQDCTSSIGASYSCGTIPGQPGNQNSPDDIIVYGSRDDTTRLASEAALAEPILGPPPSIIGNIVALSMTWAGPRGVPQTNPQKANLTCDGVPGFGLFEEAAESAIAEYPVNSYTPAWLRGIFIHAAFSRIVQSFPGYGVTSHVNVSYKDRLVAGWLDFGSVRPDAVSGFLPAPDFVVELKTSNARLAEPQLSNYLKNLPKKTRICEIYEQID